MGAGSNVAEDEPLTGPLDDGGGVISGRTVERASGSRRVRNNVDAWRYAFVMCEDDDGGGWRADANDEIDVVMRLWCGFIDVAMGAAPTLKFGFIMAV